jgi:hypothetical protein
MTIVTMAPQRGVGYNQSRDSREFPSATSGGAVRAASRFPTGRAGGSAVRFLRLLKAALCSALLALSCGVASASAGNVYIAQAAAGAANGSSCANAYAYTFFNASGNWGSGASQIGPGTVVHVCGTIANQLGFQGSGGSGSVIELRFEPGAMMSASGAYWHSNVAIVANQNYLLINGGTANVGGTATNIQATDNGSPGATCPGGPCSVQTNVTGIYTNGNNVEIKNLGCSNLYVHASLSDNGPGNENGGCVWGNPIGSNLSIHDSTFHDSNDGILASTVGSGIVNLQVFNMQFYNINHPLFTTCNVSGASGFYVHGNSIHDFANWDTSSNAYHHDGWILNIGSGQTCDQVYDYNNWYGGDWGNNNTSPIFLDNNGGTIENTYVFNDVFTNTNTLHPWSNGINLEPGNLGNGPVHVWNNTVICGAIGGAAMQVSGQGIDYRNNVESTCATFFGTSIATSSTIGSMDYNYYANAIPSGNPAFQFLSRNSGAGPLAAQFGAWKTLVQGLTSGSEAHSGEGASAGLNSSGVPQAGSAVIGAGVNLCGMISCAGPLAPLASDTSAGNTRTPSPRPASGAWDIGAFAYVGGPAPPTGLYAVPH